MGLGMLRPKNWWHSLVYSVLLRAAVMPECSKSKCLVTYFVANKYERQLYAVQEECTGWSFHIDLIPSLFSDVSSHVSEICFFSVVGRHLTTFWTTVSGHLCSGIIKLDLFGDNALDLGSLGADCLGRETEMVCLCRCFWGYIFCFSEWPRQREHIERNNWHGFHAHDRNPA